MRSNNRLLNGIFFADLILAGIVILFVFTGIFVDNSKFTSATIIVVLVTLVLTSLSFMGYLLQKRHENQSKEMVRKNMKIR